MYRKSWFEELRRKFPHMRMAAGEGAGGGGGAPETMDVDIDGVTVALPKAHAEKVIARRTADKEKNRQQSEELNRLKQKADEETARATKAEEDRLAMEAAKKGDTEKMREELTKANNAKVQKLADKYRDVHLEAIVAKAQLPKLASESEQAQMIRDVAAQLRGSCRFDLEQDTLVVIGQDGRPALADDGKPKTADALLAEFLAVRSYLRAPSQGAGSGAHGATQGKGEAVTIKSSQRDHKNAEQARLISTGKIKIVDG